MDCKEKLLGLRQNIDEVDRDMLDLFGRRMMISEQIADVKSAGNIAVTDESREQQVLDRTAAAVSENNRADALAFMRTLMALSRLRQNTRMMPSSGLLFPKSAEAPAKKLSIAFQGVVGAWSEQAAQQLFPGSPLQSCDYFEDVFEIVKSGQADFGVLPIENSQTGAIGEVYDLLRRHGCYITGQTWVTVSQCLLACEGATVSDIREIFSHPEGFNQCRRYLKGRNWTLTSCRNTAYAAKMVAEKQDLKNAAIGSRNAAKAHGLTVISPDITDNANNQTRFIAIAANPIYDENSDITSITFSTAHKSGALCAVLQSFMLSGINLSRIESRPVSAGKYRFFADLQANILEERTLDALRLASAHCDYFEVLGCYRTTEV